MKVKSVLAVAALVSCVESFAGSTSNLEVSAKVVDSCSITTSSLNFGTVDPLAPAKVSSIGAVNVTCTKDAGYAISLDAGKGQGATTSSRKMSSREGSDGLKYGLYRDFSYTIPWGTSNERYKGFGTGIEEAVTVYGFVPPGQVVRSGIYLDTVTATVSFEGCC